MKKCLILLITVFCFNSCAEGTQTNQFSAEQEIRSLLCKIENGDYAAAQNNLEKVLQKEPQNIYAQRLLPGVLVHRIKKDDKSAENIAQIRKSIEAYERFLQNPQISSEEKTRVNYFLIRLFEEISEEEKTKEHLKRVSDTNRSPADRSNSYTALAAQQNTCVHEITYEETKLEKSEIEKAKNCIEKGLEYINQAIMLNGNNESAWSIKTSLLFSASKIAELENDRVRKDSLQKQAKGAMKRFQELSEKQRELSEKQRELLNKEDEERDKQPPSEKKTNEKEKVSQELIEYKAETPLNKLVKEIYIPSNSHITERVAPVPVESDEESDDKTEDDDEILENSGNQKRELKEFSPEDEEIVAELPDNVSSDLFGESSIYTADSEGISYMIFSQPRPSIQSSDHDDSVLNTLAWSIVKPLSNFWLMGDAPGSYEVKLLRKENLSGQPARIYALKIDSCSEKKDGMLFVLVGKQRNYGIEIRGANEQDPRVQRFLKSLRFIERE